jgi:hypothetical protein
VAEIVEAPGLALCGGAADDRITIDEHVDGAQIAGEVAGIGVGFGEPRGSDPSVVLGTLGRAVA